MEIFEFEWNRNGSFFYLKRGMQGFDLVIGKFWVRKERYQFFFS